MTETGWQAIGRIAKARRERLGLNQDELAQYGGPRVATVGKFERAAQAKFPTRTQHQIETALGWSRGVIENFVGAWEESEGRSDLLEQWDHDLIEEDIPDMGRTLVDESQAPMRAAMGPLAGSVSMLQSVLRLVPNDRLDDAVRDALLAILPHLDAAGATRLGRELRIAFPPEGGDSGGDSAPIGAQDDDGLHVDLAAYPGDTDG